MAQNYIQPGEFIHAAATDPATPDVGKPVRVGTIAGVAVTHEAEGGNAAGESTIATKGVFDLPVVGSDGSTDAAVSLGDKIYYDAAIDGLNKNTAGTLFGKALEAVEAGATTTINVLLIQA